MQQEEDLVGKAVVDDRSEVATIGQGFKDGDT